MPFCHGRSHYMSKIDIHIENLYKTVNLTLIVQR